jgi:hypothetical protein
MWENFSWSTEHPDTMGNGLLQMASWQSDLDLCASMKRLSVGENRSVGVSVRATRSFRSRHILDC